MISETTFNSTITSTPPYSKLAIVFDEMMTNVNYRRWAKYILTILKKENFRKGNLLDIGCGTGQLLSRLSKTRYNLEGCDSSPEMLAVARKKLPDIHFYEVSLPALDEIPSGKFDIMLCLFDTINYLMEPSALEQSFITVFEKLKRPGIFIFDVVTREHCKKYFQDLSENEIVKKQIAYSRDSFFDRKANIQNNIIRIYTPEGIFEEIHQQRIYDFQLIKDIIRQCSDFQLSGCLEDFSFREATNKSSRIHFVLKKKCENMIEIFNASVVAAKRRLLSNIALKIQKGEFVYLIGKTGSGKTTLLRLIYMDLFPSRGNVIVDKYSSSNIRKKHIPYLRRKVGVVFQDFKLLLDRNVFDNVAFALQVRGIPRRQMKSKILSVLTQVGLHHRRYHMPQNLSGGEQQRVVIARALVNEPLILLADEPTGNLDPEAAEDILDLLEDINRKGTAVLMATHNYSLIKKYPHRTLMLENGVLREKIDWP